MKINFSDRKVIISFNVSTFVDQVLTLAFVGGIIFGTFWYAPEQLGW